MDALNPDDVIVGTGDPAFDITGLSDSPRVRPDGGLLTPMISYAQNLEDVMLRRALQDIGRGFYVDIGACDPDTDSVTRWFYENGWRGINVDPDPQYHARLVERRPEDTNLQCVIGGTSANVLFNITSKRGWSTGSAKQLAEIARRGDVSTRAMLLPAITLDQLLALSSGRTIDFLKIDAEGMEKEILDSTCFALQRPRIIVAEATLLDSQIPCHETWEPNLLRKGYKFAWFDGLNRFYVRCEDEWRLQLFKVPPCVFDHFFGVTIAAKVDEAERERETLQVAISEREAAAAAAEARASAAEAKAGAAEASVSGAQAELAAQRGRVAELERERDEGRAALARLEAETAGLQARIDERDAALAAAEGRAGAAESEAAGLRVRIGELAAVTATTAGRASAAEASFAKAQSEITQLREAIDRAETDIRQRGAVEFTLRGDIESLRRALNRAERQRSERAEDVEALRSEVAAHRAAAATAHSQIHSIEAKLVEAQREIEAQRARPATAAEEQAERELAGTLKAEIAALRRDLSATGQVGHELIAASTTAVVAREKPDQRGSMRLAMLGFAGATRTRALARGDRARDAKQWQVAARHYRKALARDPLDAPCWVQYGHALKETGCLPEAEAAYRRSLGCAPDVADTHLQLGHVLKLQGRAKAAQAAYLRAFALDPDMPAPTEELAGFGWSQTHLTQMKGLLAKPDITQLRAVRDAADAARDRQDWPEAAKLYQEFVTADPTALDIAVQLGHALKETGDLDRAAQAYYGVLEARPRDDDLHLQIGHLEKLRRDLSAAGAHYQRAAQINPANLEARRESEALRHRVGEARPGDSHTPGPARGRSDPEGEDLVFLDASAGEIYQQLLSAMA
jgi:FkbM family methyltransferase